ncbi:response regulator [Sphingobacterium sp. InxBP1]|uniref:hybrid sensor histidine kinase/response regulator transcription factor n=1 Tax=Sphingobacterium sp. InxBP1 TaxID=2870328 RepID=UPI002243D71F|nr:response regulator [Sphingobacterium sp. InxBP1]MCW8310808.1 response regulator [Sphingobacterium sp. InxBP1]
MVRFMQMIISLCLYTWAAGPLYGQHIALDPMAKNYELPSLTINQTIQDDEGYIWFASTQGLSRFDAYNILNFKLRNADGKVATDQNIRALAAYGHYLVLGSEKGVYLLDKRKYTLAPLQDKRLENVRINTLLVDRLQRLWVGTDDGLFIYDKHLNPLTERQLANILNRNMRAHTVNALFEDKQQNIWIGVWGLGLFQLAPGSKQLISYPKLGQRNAPYKLMQDNRGQLWICTWGDGLYLFDPHRAENPYREIVIKNRRRHVDKEDLFYNIIQDPHRHYIWVLSFSGITTLRYQGTQLQEVDLSAYFDQTTNIFNDIYADRNGTLWLAIGGKGMSMLSFNKPVFRNYAFRQIKEQYSIAPNINMLYCDPKGVLWFNLERLGFGSLQSDGRELSTYSNSDFKDLISIRAVTSAIDVDDQLWVGSAYEASINVFKRAHPGLKLSHKIDLQQFSPEGIPSFFYKDSDQQVWIATNRGLLLRKSQSTTLERVSSIVDQPVSIAEDHKNGLWVATKSSGLYYLQRHQPQSVLLHIGKETPVLKTDQIETMDIDRFGNLWIGTKSNRLLRYQPASGKAEEVANTTLFGKNQLLDIVCLPHHTWLSTTRNLYKIDPLNKQINEFAASDSLQVSMFAKRAFAVDKQQQAVFFGGYNGVVRLDENSLVANFKEKVLITDIKVNNKSLILTGKTGKFRTGLEQLTLSPNDQNIEIAFSTLPFTQHDKIRYAYKLEGVDEDWIMAPRDRLFATYNNLGKGSYRFLVKATDLNNQWDEAITVMEISKTPAFYESNLAYVCYVLLLGGLAFVFMSYSFNRIKLRSDLKVAQIEKEKADELAQSKLSYFTNVSHDLLTPLTIISCLVDDVQMTTKNNLEQFDSMRLNLSRLKRLLQQILDFRKIEHNTIKLQVSHAHFPSFIDRLAKSHFAPLAKKKNIQFEILHGECPEIVFYDEDKIDKVLFNLLSNAFKYTMAGGKVTLSYYVVSRVDGEFLHIYVRDSGEGIHPAELTKIFTPFYANSSAAHPESNGIGLSVSKQLIDMHGGRIEVESVLQQGSIFQVVIPVNRSYYVERDIHIIDESFSNTLQEHPVETAEAVQSASAGCLGENRLQLLLVEDNEELRNTMCNILSRNYQVHLAVNGQEGLEKIQQQEIDIVVSDIMMPEMDGLSFCKAIKSNTEYNHIPVLLLTAKSSLEDRIECYQAGADGYISKPFDVKVLEAKIQSFIINKRCKQLNFHSNTQINIAALDYTPADERFIQKMVAAIEEHLADDQFDVLKLGDLLGLSKSTLYRKTKVLLDISPSEFIKNIRLKHACQLMEKDRSITVSEVAYETGFTDPRYFATCFKTAFGLTPSEFQKKCASAVS